MTQEQVQALFDYNSDTGDLIWKQDRGSNRTTGRIAGTMRKEGYRRVSVGKKFYYVHRLVYLWHFSVLPKLIDHVNGNTKDNRIENLRPASSSDNSRNSRKCSADTSSSYKGVSWNKLLQKWTVQVHVNNTKKHIGVFVSETAAALAYNEAALSFFGKFAKLNILEEEQQFAEAT